MNIENTHKLIWEAPKLEVLSIDETQQTSYYYYNNGNNDDGAFGNSQT